jgi:hypothetical protein
MGRDLNPAVDYKALFFALYRGHTLLLGSKDQTIRVYANRR